MVDMLCALISASNGGQFKEIRKSFLFFLTCPFLPSQVIYTNGPVTEHVHTSLDECERESIELSLRKAIKYLALKDIFYALFSAFDMREEKLHKKQKEIIQN